MAQKLGAATREAVQNDLLASLFFVDGKESRLQQFCIDSMPLFLLPNLHGTISRTTSDLPAVWRGPLPRHLGESVEVAGAQRKVVG